MDRGRSWSGGAGRRRRLRRRWRRRPPSRGRRPRAVAAAARGRSPAVQGARPRCPPGRSAIGAAAAPGAALDARRARSRATPLRSRAFIASTSAPSSPRVPPVTSHAAQFAARFGPTSAAIAAVRARAARATGSGHVACRRATSCSSCAGTAGAVRRRAARRDRAAGGSRRRARLPARARPPGCRAAIARDVAGVVGVVVARRASAPSRVRATHAVRARRTRRPASSRRATVHRGPERDRRRPRRHVHADRRRATPTASTTAWAHGDDGTGHTVALVEFAPYAPSRHPDLRQVLRRCSPTSATRDPNVHDVDVDGGTSPGSAVGVGRADARHRGAARARARRGRRRLRGAEQRDRPDRHAPADRDGRHRPGREHLVGDLRAVQRPRRRDADLRADGRPGPDGVRRLRATAARRTASASPRRRARRSSPPPSTTPRPSRS